jgi:hypothetical protein
LSEAWPCQRHSLTAASNFLRAVSTVSPAWARSTCSGRRALARIRSSSHFGQMRGRFRPSTGNPQLGQFMGRSNKCERSLEKQPFFDSRRYVGHSYHRWLRKLPQNSTRPPHPLGRHPRRTHQRKFSIWCRRKVEVSEDVSDQSSTVIGDKEDVGSLKARAVIRNCPPSRALKCKNGHINQNQPSYRTNHRKPCSIGAREARALTKMKEALC